MCEPLSAATGKAEQGQPERSGVSVGESGKPPIAGNEYERKVMEATVEKFEQWCVVEIMGHKRFAGFVTEQAVGGASFVRIDVPAVTMPDGRPLLPAFTKLFGAASIYCLSPCTEETARAFAQKMRVEAFNQYEAPRLSSSVGTDEAPDDDEESFDEVDEF